nr:hypothetical protein [Sicyoidochytrium minutum DNA virus]
MPRIKLTAAQRRSPKKKKACSRKTVGVVLDEFKTKQLRSSSGQRVTSRSQALAIGLDESRRNCGYPPKQKTTGAPKRKKRVVRRRKTTVRRKPATKRKTVAKSRAKTVAKRRPKTKTGTKKKK